MANLRATVDLQTPAESAFALLCSVEKWPLWLPFVRSAQLRTPAKTLELGTEVSVRSAIPGDEVQVFEIDRFIQNHHISLVGVYSTRRRLDFRIETQSTRSRLHARLQYPAYGGRLGILYDQMRRARKLAAQFDEALLHFKHLVEYDRSADALIADF